MKFDLKLLIVFTAVIALASFTETNSKKFRMKKSSSHKSAKKLKNQSSASLWVRPLIKTAQNYHAFANLPYCPGDIINQLACPLCDKLLDNSYEVYKFHKEKHRGYTYTYVILFSIHRNEVVISFAGPKHPHPAFYSTIYSRGFRKLNADPSIEVESTYVEAFEGTFKQSLYKNLKKYQEHFKTGDEHRYVFVGHSLGGSMAVLAAFDLVNDGIIKADAHLENPLVYTYGQLRIGNARFIERVNEMFRVVRIVKSNDVYPRMPACTWVPSLNRFRCERDIDYTRPPHHWSTKQPLYNYIQHYFGQHGGGLQAGVLEPYKGDRHTYMSSFLETSENSTENSKESTSEEESEEMMNVPGWTYSQNNPGYMIPNLGDPFDAFGRTNDMGKVSYSQPLGAEVLYSNNFKRYTICQYFYGVPNCEKVLDETFLPGVGKEYYNHDLTDC